MKRQTFLIFLAAFFASMTVNAQKDAAPLAKINLNQADSRTDTDKYLDAMHRNITSEKLFGYVKQLCDPALEGRLAGSAGMAKAVSIVEGYFRQWNLTPAGNNGSYIQEFPQPHVEIHEGSTMEILLPSKGTKGKIWTPKTYPWSDGWYAGNNTDNGDITADVVYAGFGVTAPELGYDDYKGINVKGKIVLIEGETPNHSNKPDSIKMWYKHSLHVNKMNNAVKNGAIGLLYKWVPGPGSPYTKGLVYCNVTDTVVNDIFNGTGRTYAQTVKKIRETFKPCSFNTGKRAHIKMDATYFPNSIGKNIFGMIKGSDPKQADEYIIISAHLDHLGLIPYLIPGANDNNSSTSVLLGVAEAMAKSSIRPKRSIVFMSVDGEESGLTGSTYYINHPLFPKDKVKAILNLEMVGTGEVMYTNYNYNYPEFGELLKKANDTYVHRRLLVEEDHFLTRPRSDGTNFMKAGYPCADFRCAGGGYYHSPKDSPDTINPELLQSEAEWMYWSALYFANK